MSGVPADGIITIPAYVNGVKVAGIAYKAFEYNEQIKQVTVAEEITSFGPNCFRNCVNLTSVKISDKTTVISDFMFDGCKSLKQFDFPDSLVQIRSNGFSNTGLETVVLPQSVKDLWDYVFDGCANLQSVDLGQVTSLGAGIFKNCVKLESIAIPDSVKKLEGNKMFYGCENLSDIKFPSNPIPVQNTFLDDTAYYLNPDNWENGVLYLNKHLIYLNGKFSNVTDYQIKEGTVCIAETAFSGSTFVSKLTSVTLPDSLVRIGVRAFTYCKKLTNANIPSSVMYVGEDAFINTALFKRNQTNYLDNWLLSYDAAGATEITLAENTVGIADGKVFSNYNSVTKVILPSSLKYIG